MELEDAKREVEVEKLAHQKWVAEYQRKSREEEAAQQLRQEEELQHRWGDEQRRWEAEVVAAEQRVRASWLADRRQLMEQHGVAMRKLEDELETRQVLTQAQMAEESFHRQEQAVAQRNEVVARLEVRRL